MSSERENIGRTRRINKTSTSSDIADISDNKVVLPNGDEVPVSEDLETAIISVKRGPYRAHFVVAETDNGKLQVQPGVGVEKLRPAILKPDDFFNFNKEIRAESKSELRRIL